MPDDQLAPYDEFAKPPLRFPIRGGDGELRYYESPPLDAPTGIYLVRALAGDPAVTAAPAGSLWEMVLGCTAECREQRDDPGTPRCGSAYDQMVADRVPMDALVRAGFATLADFQSGRPNAIEIWREGVSPEAMAAAVQMLTRTIRPSTQPAAATTTRRPASGTGTKRTPPKPARKASASRSSKSSTAGRSSSRTSRT